MWRGEKIADKVVSTTGEAIARVIDALSSWEQISYQQINGYAYTVERHKKLPEGKVTRYPVSGHGMVHFYAGTQVNYEVSPNGNPVESSMKVVTHYNGESKELGSEVGLNILQTAGLLPSPQAV